MAFGLTSTVTPFIGLLQPRSQSDQLVGQSTSLNDSPSGDTFTRATSAYDPYRNTIVAPGVRRRRSMPISKYQAIQADLIEGAATNLLAAGSSDHLEMSSLWTEVNLGSTSFGVTAPDGTATACEIFDNSTNGQHRIQQSITKSASAIAYSLSAVFKADSLSMVSLGMSNSGNTAAIEYSFDLSAGTFLNRGGTFTNSSATITKLPNGWWYCTLTATSDTDTTLISRVRLYSGGTNTYAGTGQGLKCAWATLTQSAFPTSYISNRNLILHSQVFTSGWTPTRATVAALSIALPDGSTGGYSLTEDTTASNNHVILATTLSATNGQTFTYTAWVKRNTGTRNIQIQPLIVSNGASFNFDLGAGTTGTNAGIGSTPFTSLSSTITAIGNFYQCSATFTVASTGTLSPYLFMLNGTTSTYTGDGSSSLALWRAQLEYGSSATSYWGTDATVGGRDADALTSTYSTGTGAGTMLAFVIPYGWSSSPGGISPRFLDDAATTGVLELLTNAGASNHPFAYRKDAAGVQSVQASTLTLSNGVLSQIAMTFTPTLLSSFYNGVAGNTTALTAPLVASTGQVIGNNQSAAAPAYSWVAVLAWSRALSASELLVLSAALAVTP